nr:2139_t:CDS:2 [Entrophospora candida]
MFINLLLVIIISLVLSNNDKIVFAEPNNQISRIAGIDGDHQFIDSYGRQRFFRGLNVVYKGYPYYPKIDAFDPVTSFTEEDIQILSSVNMNVIRLGVLWAGVEPVQNQYNESYLQVIKGIVDKCNQYGIYVLLDSHQDVMNEKFCGEGVKGGKAFPFPYGFPTTYDANDVPTGSTCKINWPMLYTTSAVSKAWQNFYDNYKGIRDAFINQWLKIVGLFKDSNNLLGYDLLNEPWAGDILGKPHLLKASASSKENLGPLWNDLNTAIRTIDNNGIIFYTAVTWDLLGSGFDTVPGGADYNNRSSFSYHYYQPPRILKPNLDLMNRVREAKKVGGATMMTEFEAAYDKGKNLESISTTIKAAESNLQSWIGWQYKDFFPLTRMLNGEGLVDSVTGKIITDTAVVFSQTYPEAVAGKIISSGNDDGFSLTYNIDTSIEQPTIIRIQETYHYPNGFSVEIVPEGLLEWVKSDGGNLAISMIDKLKITDGQEFTVRIISL